MSFPINGIGTVRGIEFGPEEGPVALLVHGWAGWREQLAAFIEPLASQGFRVIAFDAPSHGASGPGRHGRHSSTVVEMADALAAVAAAVGSIRLVVAHSLGAMSLAWAAQHRGLRFGAAAVIAPATSVSPVLDTFQRLTGIGSATRQRLVPIVERRIGFSLDDFDVPTLAAGFADRRPVPLLAVHDIDDAELPTDGARALVAAWPCSELVLTEGLGHRRILWDPAVVQRVSTFATNVKNA